MDRRHALVRQHLESGLREHTRGNASAASDAYRQALALAPDHPDALNLLGVALLQLGQAEQALEPLQRAARALRHRPDVLGNLAQAHFTLGRFAEAGELYRRASRLDPRQPQFRMGLANSLALQGKLAEAERLLRSLTELRPNDPLAWFNLGNVARDQGRADEAERCFRKALAADPGWIDARLTLGSLLHGLYRFEEAEREYRSCLAASPDHLPALYNLASVLIDTGRFEEAEAPCRELLRRERGNVLARTALASAVSAQGRLAEAVECLRAAGERAPQDAGIARSLGSKLAALGDLPAALRELERALALQPDAAATRYVRATALLAHGHWRDGWREFGHRPAARAFAEAHPETRLQRTLSGEERALWLLGEQGLGDELFFLRFARPLAERGIALTCRANPKLHSLLERIEWVTRVVDASVALPPAHDAACMLTGDLPHALAVAREAQDGQEAAGAAAPDPAELPPPLRLPPLPASLARMQERLRAAGPAPYVGVTWRGGTPPSEQRSGSEWLLYKSVPIESLGMALKALPGTVLVLQRNPAPGELERFARALGRPVHDGSDLNADLEAMLALLACLDEYVAVSNTNVHLRAAAGRTARVLVPLPAEWRWMAGGDSSPWFPGSSVYRQRPSGDWSEALRTLREDLAAALDQPH